MQTIYFHNIRKENKVHVAPILSIFFRIELQNQDKLQINILFDIK